MENNYRTFLNSEHFDVIWEKLGFGDAELRELQNLLIKNPECGALMRGTGGFRKMRYARGNKGKSGSVRVIYLDLHAYNFVVLMLAYPKSEKETLSQAERNALKAISGKIIQGFKSSKKEW
ncbi:MAG: type II toxin-antitoxin system RelE/ParE family toxin [Clostridiales Family XIII bacterium]|nr:type II toxin-antitoxin system RelE/ParE family toxin [Clostridiales Family XIII bacterium]